MCYKNELIRTINFMKLSDEVMLLDTLDKPFGGGGTITPDFRYSLIRQSYNDLTFE